MLNAPPATVSHPAKVIPVDARGESQADIRSAIHRTGPVTTMALPPFLCAGHVILDGDFGDHGEAHVELRVSFDGDVLGATDLHSGAAYSCRDLAGALSLRGERQLTDAVADLALNGDQPCRCELHDRVHVIARAVSRANAADGAWGEARLVAQRRDIQPDDDLGVHAARQIAREALAALRELEPTPDELRRADEIARQG